MGLNNLKLDSKILCIRKDSVSNKVIEVKTLYTIRDKAQILLLRFKNKFTIAKKKVFEKKGCSDIGQSALYSTLDKIKFDILHLNWVVGGFVNFKDIQKVKKPIVITLHDAVMFTGICHVIDDCENYKHQCGKCPKLNSNEINDHSRTTFLLKEEYYKNLNIVFVGPSNWIVNKAKESNLLKDRRVEVIPNGINTDIFKPIEKKLAKQKLQLNGNKKQILFGAVTSSDKNKGFDLLKSSFTFLEKNEDIEVFTFGKIDEDLSKQLKVKNLGYIANEDDLALIYSAADVMVVPSIQESFGQTASEALSCGTPVVAFATSGLLDIVDHKINGYLAKPFDTEDLAKGIFWCLNQTEIDLPTNARNKASNKFDMNLVANQYKELFESLV